MKRTLLISSVFFYLDAVITFQLRLMRMICLSAPLPIKQLR
ncbi:Uncharacterised protein [Buttiauxella agrestis]|uniref:Uncharacterized protein n=1 Tax=Buttiauxella agrestis TaxID=82977 RepID=A0A381KNF1_9ENTR|nr:Uncharacterised protein [Buttiauxella agrestis]